MDRKGCAFRKRSARIFFVDPLFIECVTALVNGTEQRGKRRMSQRFCGDPDIVEAERCDTGMNGAILSSAVPVKAHAGQDFSSESDLFCRGEFPFEEIGISVFARESFPQDLSQLPGLGIFQTSGIQTTILRI